MSRFSFLYTSNGGRRFLSIQRAWMEVWFRCLREAFAGDTHCWRRSALLGALNMLITLPIPSFLSKFIMSTQKAKMKMVSAHKDNLYIQASCFCSDIQTDDRVQWVTQSMFPQFIQH